MCKCDNVALPHDAEVTLRIIKTSMNVCASDLQFNQDGNDRISSGHLQQTYNLEIFGAVKCSVFPLL